MEIYSALKENRQSEIAISFNGFFFGFINTSFFLLRIS